MLLKEIHNMLNESSTKSKSMYIQLLDTKSDEDVEVKLTVDYQLGDQGQNYDHEGITLEIDPESIEYIVSESFEFQNKKYNNGFDLSKLYEYVFIDDEYLKKSKYLKSNTSSNLIKTGLSKSNQEEVFNHLLLLML